MHRLVKLTLVGVVVICGCGGGGLSAEDEAAGLTISIDGERATVRLAEDAPDNIRQRLVGKDVMLWCENNQDEPEVLAEGRFPREGTELDLLLESARTKDQPAGEVAVCSVHADKSKVRSIRFE
jgi:hypothetical protein